MTSHIFISYSRHEITFVDSLSRAMEERGLRPWLDFRNMVPGRPWKEQIDEAIDAASTFLLIVSKDSMQSEAVAEEWQRALDNGCRVILLIFEACPLDERLASLECVEFRGRFRHALDQLLIMLRSPATEPGQPAPQTGFRMPGGPRLFYLLSLVMALGSLLALPSLVVPFWLIRLPGQIRRRKYRLEGVILALVGFVAATAVILVVMALALPSDTEGLGPLEAYTAALAVCPQFFIPVWVVMVAMLLLSPGMYRWAGPGGALVRARTRMPKELPDLAPVTFAMEYAHRDRRMANNLQRRLEQEGHTYTEDIEKAETIIVLLSRFNQSSQHDPESRPVLPVILQAPGDVDPRLSHIQWVDLRVGPRRYKQFAALLSDPERLLFALGVMPVRSIQSVRPPVIKWAMIYFWLVVLAKTTLAAVLLLVVSYTSAESDASGPDISFRGPHLAAFALATLAGIATAYLATKSLANREGFFKSSFALAVGITIVSVLTLLGTSLLIFFVRGEDVGYTDADLTLEAWASVICLTPGLVLLATRGVRLWMARTSDFADRRTGIRRGKRAAVES